MSLANVYLSRRNLLTLLSKLDRQRERRWSGAETMRTLVKRDDAHASYPQSHSMIFVIAVEDDEYYRDRKPGAVHPEDE